MGNARSGKRRGTVAADGIKKCCTCERFKPATLEFFTKRRAKVDGLYPQCKECSNKVRREARAADPEHYKRLRKKWEAKNPERRRELYRKHNRKRSFLMTGWTEEAFERAWKMQQGRCLICGKQCIRNCVGHTRKGDAAMMDHCHKENKPRGIICGDCNLGLGKFKDNPAALRAAADYVERYSGGNALAPTAPSAA